jgi:hypothetical protein
MIEPLLLTTTLVSTFCDRQALTAAGGFFFERDQRLYLVTSRHVLIDKPSGYFPNRIELTLHTDATNLTHATSLSVPLYKDGQSLCHQGRDAGGEIDVALIKLDRAALPASVLIRCFTPAHLQHSLQEVGASLLVVGFPLGFHDSLHHLPVVRQAVIASSVGSCDPGGDASLPWKLLGVHSLRLDIGRRNLLVDELLGLNSAWYADILMTLTAPATSTAAQFLP